MDNPITYALDFDGVICDSAVETGITGWKAACKLWGDMPEAIPPEKIEQFRQVRPKIETGYEAILAMRLLYLGETTQSLSDNFNSKSQLLLQQADVSVAALKALFGSIRDNWIADDLTDWIAQNPLFPGIAEKLRQLGGDQPWFIVTTKQERFVKAILQGNGIALADANIFGLDRNKSKIQVLTELTERKPGSLIYFIEDRLPTLVNVANTKSLRHVKLIFALWGYNTAEDKVQARENGFILQQLEHFLE